MRTRVEMGCLDSFDQLGRSGLDLVGYVEQIIPMLGARLCVLRIPSRQNKFAPVGRAPLTR